MSIKMLAIAALTVGMAGAPAFAQTATTDMNSPTMKSDDCPIEGADNVNCREQSATDTTTTGSITAPATTMDNKAANRADDECPVAGADNKNCTGLQQ